MHSTPYYAQGNGLAEATNKVIKANISKVIEDSPRTWADMLSEVLWAFKTSKRTAIGTTPFVLTLGHDAILPMEITMKSLRVARQHELTLLESGCNVNRVGRFRRRAVVGPEPHTGLEDQSCQGHQQAHKG
ncbi:uncharacterized protein LOC122644943 [Telopea speciosissima]|uniref:uncharacterized protein LOC122644943 n=1 Tax=Telopea speciosissima TaxID=54955 RepID=UPI001CC33E25|nr:uncharacterized protein LOC122644943 [Telopea speciosissima]